MGLTDGISLFAHGRANANPSGTPMAIPVDNTTNEIGSILAQNNVDLQNQLSNLYDNPGIDPLRFNDYNPNTAAGIQQGTYSGQSFSAPIYAPSTVLPFARRDAFNKAQQDGAMEKTKAAIAASQGLSDLMKAPDLNNPFFQEKFNQQFYGDIDKDALQAMKDHPDNWREYLMADPTFNRKLNNYAIIADQQNKVFDKMTEAITGHASGKVVLAPEELKAANDFVTGVSNLGTDGFSSVNLQEQYQKVNAAVAFQDWFKSSGLIESITPQIKTSMSLIKDRTNIDTYNKEVSKIYDNAAESIAEELTREGGMYYGSKVYTKDYLKKYITGILGNEMSQTVESLRTNDVPYGNEGGMAEWQWKAMDDEQKKIAFMETVRKFKDFQSVGALTGKEYYGGTVVGERLFNAMDEEQLNKYKEERKNENGVSSILNPEALVPGKRYNIVTVVVKGAGGNPDKTKYAFIPIDDPNAAMIYASALKGGEEKTYYPSPDEISTYFSGKKSSTAPASNSGQQTTSGGAPIIK